MLNEWTDLPETILTRYKGVSCFSGSPAEISVPLIWFDHNEALAREDGLMIPLKKEEYDQSKLGYVWQLRGNPRAEMLSHMLGQAIWEKHYIAEAGCSEEEAREYFKERYRKSFL